MKTNMVAAVQAIYRMNNNTNTNSNFNKRQETVHKNKNHTSFGEILNQKKLERQNK